MKTCANCLFNEQCTDKEKRCEYYYPLLGSERIAEREYKEDLKEREEIYQEVIDEMNS